MSSIRWPGVIVIWQEIGRRAREAEHNTLYVVIEISRKSWVIGVESLASEKIGLHAGQMAKCHLGSLVSG